MERDNQIVIGVFIIPTGIGCEIGGHSGDATPAAKLIASVCDKLIVHPNVVNASDINEMTENMLYVEGSILDRFLQGEIELKQVYSNKILVVVNPPLQNETVNAVSAARVTIGAEIKIAVLNTPLQLIATKEKDGSATGNILGWKELIEQVKDYDFDALAITTPITVDKEIAINYLNSGGVNPWGGVEAKASKLIATALNKPVAHAPCVSTLNDYNEIVDPRMAAEMVSVCYLHCILKGLYKAPRIGKGLSVDSIDFLISPMCYSSPHIFCNDKEIPVIMVKENKTIMSQFIPPIPFIYVENYLEATGVIIAMKEGISLESIWRPIRDTEIK